MDYKKKYKKAIKIASKYYNTPCEPQRAIIIKEIISNIFPEFIENEYERIRKEIIGIVLKEMGRAKDSINDDLYNKMLNYLEECKPKIEQ